MTTGNLSSRPREEYHSHKYLHVYYNCERWVIGSHNYDYPPSQLRVITSVLYNYPLNKTAPVYLLEPWSIRSWRHNFHHFNHQQWCLSLIDSWIHQSPEFSTSWHHLFDFLTDMNLLLMMIFKSKFSKSMSGDFVAIDFVLKCSIKS